jgi:glycine cleavage system H protein
MKELSELVFPEDIRYTNSHEWVRAENEALVAGISDYAQDQLGDIVFVELPAPAGRFEMGAPFGTLESVKAVSEIYMPVAGEIVAINEALKDAPDQVNAAPYGEGWLIKIRPENLTDLNGLMDKRVYLETLKGTN